MKLFDLYEATVKHEHTGIAMEKMVQFISRKLGTKLLKIPGIEHFHNQFHIQLINLHDLKHEIKHHIFEAEKHPNFGHRIPHHYLKDKLDILFNFLEKLETDFHHFMNK